MTNRKVFSLFVAGMTLTACSSSNPGSASSGGSAATIAGPATDSGTSDEGSAEGAADAGSDAVSAADAAGDAGATIPGKLRYGGVLPLPSQASYTGQSGGNHFSTYAIVISNTTPPFAPNWSITTTQNEDDGYTDVDSFDLNSGILDSNSFPTDHHAPGFEMRSQVGVNGVTSARFSEALVRISFIVADMANGRPLNEENGAEPIPALKPYADYLANVQANPVPPSN